MDSLRSGYAFHCPPRSLRNGDHVVQLNVHARSGEVLEHRFTIVVRKSEEFEDGMTIRRRMTQVEADVSEEVLDSLGHRPGFRLMLRQQARARSRSACWRRWNRCERRCTATGGWRFWQAMPTPASRSAR